MTFRQRRIRNAAGLVLLAAATALAAFICAPRRYDVPLWTPLPGTQYLSLPDGTRIGYQILRPTLPRRRYPVIFLQGGPGGYIHAKVLELLTPLPDAGFSVYAYDQSGSGSSSRLGRIRDYTVSKHIADLDAVIEATGADSVILLGQSWGAILAALYTASHPGRVAGLILTGPGPLPPRNPQPEKLPAPDSLRLRAPAYSNRQANEQAATLRTRAAAWLALRFGIKLMPDAEADAFQSTLNRLLAKPTFCDGARAPAAVQPGSGYYVQLMTVQSLGRTPDPRPVLRRLGIPVLILKGQCDNQPWSYTQEYAQLFRDSRLLVIPGAGHSIGAEQPEAYRQALLQFLEARFPHTAPARQR